MYTCVFARARFLGADALYPGDIQEPILLLFCLLIKFNSLLRYMQCVIALFVFCDKNISTNESLKD